EGVMIEAIARAANIPPAVIRRAVMLAGDPTRVAVAALNQGAVGLDQFALRVMQPVKPMLADSADDPAEALLKLGEAVFEYKLDGARIQVHKSGSEVRVFTRRLNEVTAATPEVVEAIMPLQCREIILDGEVVALRADGAPHAFQTTMRRFGRKLDVERLRETLPLAPFFFDCLHLDGKDLIDLPGQERFAAMSAVVPQALRVQGKRTADPDTAEAFFEQALGAGHEGVMAKDLRAPYEAGNRGSSWLKIKRFHTLDLVVLAAEWGHGRRHGWLSNLHLGARDAEAGAFVMLGKTFKGMTDETLNWQTEKLQELAISSDEHIVRVRPELVVGIAFNEIQASKQYPAGMALRFARVKGYRPDKNADDADTLEAVRVIFDGQGGG
ncbi:MAG: ATP-dependent DNA ligase, partial [Gammaproteobacteria bacterium]